MRSVPFDNMVISGLAACMRLYNFGAPRCSQLQLNPKHLYSYAATRHMIQDIDPMGKKRQKKK